MTGDPPLSVVMPVHNCVAYVEESVRSILAQSFREYELVIGDDGSNDGTSEILGKLASEDSRIRVLRRERNSGLAASAAWVISHSRAPLIAMAHADDISHPDRLKRQIKLFEAAPDASLVGTLMIGIDDRGSPLHPPNLWRLVRPSVFAPFPHSSAMFRRSNYAEVGGYRPQADYWEDHDLYWRLCETGRILVIPEVLASYRYSSVSLRARGSAEQLEHALDVMYRSTALVRANRDYESVFHAAPAGHSPEDFRRSELGAGLARTASPPAAEDVAQGRSQAGPAEPTGTDIRQLGLCQSADAQAGAADDYQGAERRRAPTACGHSIRRVGPAQTSAAQDYPVGHPGDCRQPAKG